MLPLYQLADQYNRVLELAMDDEIDQKTITDTLESIQCTIEEKAKNGIAFVRQLEAYRDSVKTERERLEKIEKAADNRAKWMKEYFKTTLETMKLHKIQTPLGSLAIERNSRGSVIIEDEKLVPAAYIDIIPEQKVANKERLYEVCKTGKQVPGVKYEVGTHLRIR